MPSFNKLILVGHLTRDPETKVLPSNTTVCEFGIAVNRKYRTAGGEDREEVCFVDCTAFGKTGEVIAQHFAKGKPMLAEGRLKFDHWEDKTGGKRSKLSMIVENFQFVGGRDDGGEGGGDNSQRQPARQQNAPPRQPQGQQQRSYPPAQVRPAPVRSQAKEAWGDDSADAPF